MVHIEQIYIYTHPHQARVPGYSEDHRKQQLEKPHQTLKERTDAGASWHLQSLPRAWALTRLQYRREGRSSFSQLPPWLSVLSTGSVTLGFHISIPGTICRACSCEAQSKTLCPSASPLTPTRLVSGTIPTCRLSEALQVLHNDRTRSHLSSTPWPSPC